MNRFPSIKLSYEKITHNKVCNMYDMFMVIPFGTKCFLWFTQHQEKPTCFLIKLNSKHEMVDYLEYSVSTSILLFHGIGTILYGTLFTIPITNEIKYFTIENIYYHNGINITCQNWIQKILLTKQWLENQIQSIVSPYISIGLPIISYSESHFQKSIQQCPYLIQHFEYRKYNQYNLSFIFKPTHFQNNMTSTFLVKSGIEEDIYYLFSNSKNQKPLNLVLNIPNYKTSIWMNSLFRNIKENRNLDSLEESDDEEEFQNQQPDKYILKDKMFQIVCYFNSHLKRWVPIIDSEKQIV